MTDRVEIIELIQRTKSFYVLSHMQPDGDSIGSLLAMGEVLQVMGKDVKLFMPGQIPRRYAFLKGSDQIAYQDLVGNKDVVAIVLDSSDLDRLGYFKANILQSHQIINIDHHITNQHFGNLNLVDPAASATGEIIFDIIKDLQVALTESIAEALYVAISTDTGSFKYDNTTAKTHLVIAALLEYNLSPALLSQRMFDERPLSFYVLLKEALSSIEIYDNRKIAVMTLGKDIRERTGAMNDDLEGIVNFARNIEGVELGILFYIESQEEVKVGFRSRTVDVSVLAGKLNGGGHPRAAGCRILGNFEFAKEIVMREACALLNGLPV